MGNSTRNCKRYDYSEIFEIVDHLYDLGYPLIQEKFLMEQVIKKDEMIEKIENTLISPSKSKRIELFEKYIETMGDIRQENWYTPGPSVNNEILFDVVEYLDCIMEK
jgi:hypothetical protein